MSALVEEKLRILKHETKRLGSRLNVLEQEIQTIKKKLDHQQETLNWLTKYL